MLFASGDTITVPHQGGGGETAADGQIGEPIRAPAFLSRDLPLKARMLLRIVRLGEKKQLGLLMHRRRHEAVRCPPRLAEESVAPRITGLDN